MITRLHPLSFVPQGSFGNRSPAPVALPVRKKGMMCSATALHAIWQADYNMEDSYNVIIM